MLAAVGNFIPDLLPFVDSAYSTPSILLWDDIKVMSSEGVQQGNPLGPSTILHHHSQIDC